MADKKFGKSTRAYTPPLTPLERPLTLLFAVLAGAAAGLAVLATAFVALGMDQVWLLYGAGRLLSGAQIYGAEVMESNPPFILWVSAIPAALARAIHQPASFGFRLCVLLLTAAILAWCVVLLRHVVNARKGLLGWAFGAGLMAVTYWLSKSTYSGEREHLLLLFILPYLFATALRLRNTAIPAVEAFAIGLSAAVAVCCKPQHLLIVIGMELVLAIHRRSLRSLVRPEFFGVALGGVAYLGAVELFAPRYLHQVVPLLTQTYWAFGGIPLLKMFLQKRSLLLFGLAVLCAAFAWLRRNRLQTAALQVPLLGAVLCSLAAYWVQGTGFNYQLIPASSLLALSAVLLIADFAAAPSPSSGLETAYPLPGAIWPPKPIPPMPAWIAPTLAAAVCLVVMAGLNHRIHRRADADLAATVDPKTQALLDSYPAGTPVAWITLDPGFFPPVVAHDFFYATRFPHLWLVPAIVRTEQHQPHLKKHLTPQQTASLTATQDRFMVEDLTRFQPKLVAIERCNDLTWGPCEGMNNAPIDLLQWFSKSPDFNQAWQHYKFLETAGRYDFYTRID
jgi:hypothetical protein